MLFAGPAGPPPALGFGGRTVETRSRPARREIRSARSASRVLLDGVWWWPWPEWGKEDPRWPSLMAVVDRAESEVVVELGVPGASVGVSGLEGGSGISIKVGVAIALFLPGSWISLVYIS